MSSIVHAKSAGRPLYEDVAVKPEGQVESFDISDEELKKFNIFRFKQLVEEYAMNEVRTPEGRPLTQVETNLLVKNFVESNISPQLLLNVTFQGELELPFSGKTQEEIEAQKAQVIQTLSNIAKTRNEMAAYMNYEDVRCFYRNFRDSEAAEKGLVPANDVNTRSPLANILKASDDVVIVGKCRGCGLLNVNVFAREYAMSPETREYYSACAGK